MWVRRRRMGKVWQMEVKKATISLRIKYLIDGILHG
jgi:hypothetical protein